MIRGSCLCGAVRFEVTAPFEGMHHCHCSRCRKAHGAAFSTFAQVQRSGVRITVGEKKIRDFQSSEKVLRSFCADCGSNLFFKFQPLPELVWVAVGVLDDDPGMRPEAHIFAASIAPWHEITDDLPQHDEYPQE